MNTKFSLPFLIVLIVLVAAACAPTITDSSAPIAAVPPAQDQTSALIPVSGSSAADTVRTEAQASRLWSGEVFLSDNDNPDVNADTDQHSACIADDSQPRRYGGCAE